MVGGVLHTDVPSTLVRVSYTFIQVSGTHRGKSIFIKIPSIRRKVPSTFRVVLDAPKSSYQMVLCVEMVLKTLSSDGRGLFMQ